MKEQAQTDRGRDRLTALTVNSAHQLLQSFHFPLDPRLGKSVVVLKNEKEKNSGTALANRSLLRYEYVVIDRSLWRAHLQYIYTSAIKSH